MQSPDCHASELGSNTDFPAFFPAFFQVFFFQLLLHCIAFNIAKMYTPVFPLCVLCVLIFFKGYNRSQLCGTADSFLSANRMESSGCERSFGFPPVDGE